MLAIAALCLQAVLPPSSAPEAPLTAAELRAEWPGGLRHVQLLEVRPGDPAVAVLATAFEARRSLRRGGESCLALYELPFSESAAAPASKDGLLRASELERVAPFATLRTPGRMLPFSTWSNQPA